MHDGYEAVTVNKFLGKGMKEDNLGKAFDWSCKKLIVFDVVVVIIIIIVVVGIHIAIGIVFC